MKGIGNYDVYRTNAKAFQPFGKKKTDVGGKTGKTGSTESSAAEYKMSDAAKKLDPDQLKDYQKSSSGMEIAKKTVADGIELSEAAQNLLKELKEKYGNMDFFVAEFSTDEEAQKYHSQSTKKYSCVIDPKTLEEMAADESVKEKYLNIIDSADEQFDKLKEELGDGAKEVARFGINVDKDGVVSYFAELTKETARMQQAAMNDAKARRAETKAQNEKLEKTRAKNKEEKLKAEEAMKEKKAEAVSEESEGKAENPNRVTASSMEELLSKLKEALAGRVGTTVENAKETAPGQKFDMTM